MQQQQQWPKQNDKEQQEIYSEKNVKKKKPRNTHKYALRKSQLQAELKTGPLNGSTENEQKLPRRTQTQSLTCVETMLLC